MSEVYLCLTLSSGWACWTHIVDLPCLLSHLSLLLTGLSGRGPWSRLLLAVSRTVDGPCYQQLTLPAVSRPCGIMPLLVESLLPPHSPSSMQPLCSCHSLTQTSFSAFYNLLGYTNFLSKIHTLYNTSI